MSTSYKCSLLEMHSGTTGHVSGYFQDALNDEAKEGWKFVQAIRMDSLRFTLIFERNES